MVVTLRYGGVEVLVELNTFHCRLSVSDEALTARPRLFAELTSQDCTVETPVALNVPDIAWYVTEVQRVLGQMWEAAWALIVNRRLPSPGSADGLVIPAGVQLLATLYTLNGSGFEQCQAYES